MKWDWNLRPKARAIWITPLRLYWADIREVYSFTRSLFR